MVMLKFSLCLLLCFPLAAQAQWNRFAPRTDFEPLQGAVAYEPITGDGYYVGSVRTSTMSSELWRHVDGAWYHVPTATSLPLFPMVPGLVAATWPALGILVVASGQSWLFDGVDWGQLPTSTTPPPLTAMAFDELRGRMVGWRAYPSQVWEFDGASWQQVTTAASVATGWGRLTWHALLQRVVLCATNGTARTYYSWDGAAWTNHFSIQGSPNSFSLAPEPGGGVLASGGWDTTFAYGRSETWNGTTAPPISRDTLPNAPPWRATSVSWFDPVRQHTVVTSFWENWTTWRWDGAAWSLAGAGLLPPSSDHVAYDSWRGQLLMVGGWSAPSFEHSDLWARRDGEWTRIATGTFAPRRDGNVAFDSWRGRLVLFGGAQHDSGAGAYYSTLVAIGTYEWDGTTWFDVTPVPATVSNHPPALVDAAIAFDRLRGKTVVFGGFVRDGSWTQVHAATWQWDGVAWQSMNPATMPLPIPTQWEVPSMAFDSASGRCWLHVGGSLWTWDGVDWLAAGQAPGSGPFGDVRMVEDTARGVLIMLRASAQYELHATGWVLVGNREGGGVPAFDLGRGVVVGIDSGGSYEFGDPAAATIQPFGHGCVGSAGLPVLHGEQSPRLGTTLPLRLEHVAPNGLSFGLLGGPASTWLGLPLPIDLSPLGMPQCELATSIDAAAAFVGASWSIPLPASATSLLGGLFHLQAVVFDAPANPFGAVTSNAVALRIGS